MTHKYEEQVMHAVLLVFAQDERKKRELGTLVNAEALCGHLNAFNYTSCVYDYQQTGDSTVSIFISLFYVSLFKNSFNHF